MLRPDGTIALEELQEVAIACGQSPEQLRSCLRRLVDEKLMGREGSGKSALYRTTELGNALREGSMQRHSLAYRMDRAGAGWDGYWHLVTFAIPENRRSARDRGSDRRCNRRRWQPRCWVS